MTSQLNSLLVRLQHGSKWYEVEDTLLELLGFRALDKVIQPEVLDKVVQIVEIKIDAGAVFSSTSLALLISRTHSPTLYNRVRKQLLDSYWDAVKLYKSRYPDPEIEERLCSKLYEIASIDGEPLRVEILDAINEVGSETVLSTLEAILFDLEPSAKIRSTFSDALLNPLDKLKAAAGAEFVNRLSLAIYNIKSRVAVERPHL